MVAVSAGIVACALVVSVALDVDADTERPILANVVFDGGSG